ncbi:Uncharacterised protein [Salmonella enterica subsp. enterica serovar Bovismorbificans]|uniref:Uncharacterized protein n=1 Tax=Salmonella enterica subsp. enterica serovar Bovismorbificans TaxID=58097 RepID=A0A655D4R2_SALET|nr:Uncharacterised protein [Salmonella enterica subsp. enterica serovar Bovismorbificans]
MKFGFVEVFLNAITIPVHESKVIVRLSISLVSGFFNPLIGFRQVFRHSFADKI